MRGVGRERGRTVHIIKLHIILYISSIESLFLRIYFVYYLGVIKSLKLTSISTNMLQLYFTEGTLYLSWLALWSLNTGCEVLIRWLNF